MKKLYTNQIHVSFLVCAVFFCSNSYSQCKDGESSKTISYDTSFAGGGNDIYPFSFPQFDPTLGTLVKVGIETEITVKYNYQLENTDANPILYRVRVNRTDEINCSALLTTLSKTQAKNLNVHLLDKYDGVPNAGSDYVAVGPIYAFNKSPINYDVTDQVAGFLGIGTVDFDYSSITDSYPSGSSHYLYSTNATDSISFRLTYYYCAVTFLPADIMNFTASLSSSGSVRLAWYTPNDVAGEKYEVQKSIDGKTFVPIQSITSTSNTGTNYQISYQPVDEDGSKFFFRLKQYEQGGSVKYTVVKTVVLPNKQVPSIIVYPTIATDFVRVSFINMPKDDWQIRIISMNGKQMQQTDVYKSDYARIPVSHSWSPGIYILQAENKRTHAAQLSRIYVQ